MPILTSMGRKFLQFGIALFILSHFYVFLLASYGFPVNPIMAKATSILPAIDLATLVSSAIYIIGRTFIPQIAQAASYAVYLSLFAAAIYPLTSVIAMLMELIPVPGLVSSAIIAFVTGVISMSIYYYIASRIAGLPPE